jgi:SAM-dependent methyltransferase
MGYETTGQRLIELATTKSGWPHLRGIDVLDVGCGVRFTMTVINRDIAIGSYSGLEVDRGIVTFLQTEVAAHDARFRFAHWNVRNAMYNPEGIDLAELDDIPFADSFHAIWAFSLMTHLLPRDTELLLGMLRRHVRPGGKLFFSAFIDEDLDGFEDRVAGSPLLHAYYGRGFMERLIEKAGWSVLTYAPADPDNAIMSSFLCAPR